MQSKPGNVFREDPAPQHHLHDSNEPLPGNLAGQQQFEVRYSDEGSVLRSGGADGCMRQGRNAFNSDRPLNVQPTPAGVSDFQLTSTTS